MLLAWDLLNLWQDLSEASCCEHNIPRPPNYPLIYPKYLLLRTISYIRALLKGHWEVLVVALISVARMGVQGLCLGVRKQRGIFWATIYPDIFVIESVLLLPLKLPLLLLSLLITIVITMITTNYCYYIAEHVQCSGPRHFPVTTNSAGFKAPLEHWRGVM